MLKSLMKAIVSASFCLAALAPASAAPMIMQKPAIEIAGHSGLVEVQYRDKRRFDRNQRRDFRDNRRGFYHDNRHGYYNGHRGYRQQRRGYRQYNGYWFPPAAFSFGVIIGGQNRVSPGVRPGYTNPQHLSWCQDRYRSYRARDNSFQPNHGPRRACSSPFYSGR